ncbi:SDR family oxidoreductase [Qipengyuania sp. ASV99]|uniref:SDR family oxidoreductase n=1 Tax=Qipengyuania sp. ASV99 TaxID=3399681 RepID=UPI003A4C7376
MDLAIAGKTALVTGASGGLGRAIAVALAAEGVNVAIAARRADALEETAKLIENAGGRALPLVWDLSDLAIIDDRISKIEDEFGPCEILVNNTGGPPPHAAVGAAAELWASQFNAMVLSVIGITDRVLPAMRRAQWGRVITTASSGVIAPLPNLALSNALRLSLVGWSKTLAAEVAGEGVTVNVVAPGRIDTDRVRALDAARAGRESRTVEEVSAASRLTIPAGRYGRPEEFSAMVAFLAGRPASYITGSIHRVDGGLLGSI